MLEVEAPDSDSAISFAFEDLSSMPGSSVWNIRIHRYAWMELADVTDRGLDLQENHS
jgi:hypothetical protein